MTGRFKYLPRVVPWSHSTFNCGLSPSRERKSGLPIVLTLEGLSNHPTKQFFIWTKTSIKIDKMTSWVLVNHNLDCDTKMAHFNKALFKGHLLLDQCQCTCIHSVCAHRAPKTRSRAFLHIFWYIPPIECSLGGSHALDLRTRAAACRGFTSS